MRYCKNCLQPDSRPGTIFIENTCPACQFTGNSNAWDWGERVATIKLITKMYSSKQKGAYDSILGVSGGKDSTRLALWARDFLGLKPLLVSVGYPPQQLTKQGAENLNNLSELGFDVYSTCPSPNMWKTLMRKSFIEFGNWAKSTELALFSGVPQIAIELGINLILWGENPALQLGATETMGESGWDGNQLRNMNTLVGMNKEWLTSDGNRLNHLKPYIYPTNEAFEFNDIQVVFLGWAMRTWGLLENGVSSSLVGLKSRLAPAITNSDLIGLTSLDEDWVILNQMIKYYKFGFGRASDYVNEWIRKGRLSRSEGISIVNKFDGLCDDSYIKSFCLFISITETEFWEIVNSYVNQDLFEIQKSGRPIRKFQVGVDFS